MRVTNLIGAGRIGTALKYRADLAQIGVNLVTRTEGWDVLADSEGPILVAVRNASLADVVARTPEARRDDLVFLQNGALRQRLADLDLPDADRGLIYFLVASVGGPIVGTHRSVFTGRHAEAVVDWFNELGLAAAAVDRTGFAVFEWEKHVWIAAHGVLCPALSATVGEVGTTHRATLLDLVTEWAPIGLGAWGVSTDPEDLVDHLALYSAEIPDYRPSLKAFDDRNGWFVDRAAELGLSTERHLHWLEAADPAMAAEARARLSSRGR